MEKKSRRSMRGREFKQSPWRTAMMFSGILLPGMLSPAGCVASVQITVQEETDTTLKYFQRLGLDCLTIDELHLRLGRQGDSVSMRTHATRLIGEYVSQFLAGGPSNPEFAWDAARMQRLADAFPDLTSPAFRLAILAARLQSTDKNFLAWKNQLSGGLTTVELAREMELVLRSVNGELESLDASQQAGVSAEPNQGQLRFRAVLMVAEISMRLLVLDPNNDSSKQSAIRSLHQILRLDFDEQISSRQLEAMVPEFDWQVHTLESLAIFRLHTETGDVSEIMSVIERGGNSVENTASKIRVLAGAAQFEAIDRLMTDYTGTTANRSAITTDDETRIWIEAVRAGRLTPLGQSDLRQGIVWRSVRELATIDVRVLEQTLRDWGPTEIPPPPDEFSKHWIAGARGLGLALLQEQVDTDRLKNALPAYLNPSPQRETTEPSVDSEAVLAEMRSQIESGMSLLDGVKRPEYRAAFLLTAAEIDFRIGNWLEAAAEARRVLDIEADLRNGQATRAAGLLLQSRVQLAQKDPSQQLLLRQEAAELADRFASQPVGQIANLQVMIVENRQRSADQAIEFWRRYLGQFPENETARIELLTRMLEIANEPDNSSRRDRFSRVIEIVQSILGSKTSSVATKIWAVTSLVEAARNDATLFSPKDAALLLEHLESLASAPEVSIGEIGEANYATMRLAKMAGNERAQKTAMSWIIDHPQSGPWFAAALFERARELEPNWETASPDSGEFNSLLNTYRTIFENAGADVNAIRQDPNMRLIVTRLANMHFRKGEEALAENLFELILQAYPNDRDILLAAARANTASGDFQKGTDRWRRLAQFFPAGSELWRESRYNLYKCLLETDAETAETVRKQTWELDPEMPDEWKRRY